MAIAAFDLDETLIAIDSDHEWGEFLVREGLVDGTRHQQQNNQFYQQYQRGELDVDEYLAFACSVLTRFSLEELQAHRARFVESVIQPMILPKAKETLDAHREAGDYVLIITSTIEFITRPIADALGVATLIAPMPELKDNRYTGGIVGVPSFGPGKVTCLKAWLAEQSEHTLDGAWFYSDSHNDLPLLQLVDHPVAVDPDPVLRKVAEEGGWPIISLR